MKKFKKALLFIVAAMLVLTFSFTSFAEETVSNDTKQIEQKKQSEVSSVIKNELGFSVSVFGKDLTKPVSEEFSTANECYAWIKGKGLNGIIYSKSTPKKAVGVELEGSEINFENNYILKFDAKKGIYDKRVLAIQKSLHSIGFKLKADGYFGKQTYDAVKQFQKNAKLEIDGVIGEKTYIKLVSSFNEVVSITKK